jgi:hypothetical protein
LQFFFDVKIKENSKWTQIFVYQVFSKEILLLQVVSFKGLRFSKKEVF